jgi:hypothetical protein
MQGYVIQCKGVDRRTNGSTWSSTAALDYANSSKKLDLLTKRSISSELDKSTWLTRKSKNINNQIKTNQK